VEYVKFYAAWNPLKVSSARGTFVTSTAGTEPFYSVVESPLIPYYSAVESPSTLSSRVHSAGTVLVSMLSGAPWCARVILSKLGKPEAALCHSAGTNLVSMLSRAPWYARA
jgi:hypothetical protein